MVIDRYKASFILTTRDLSRYPKILDLYLRVWTRNGSGLSPFGPEKDKNLMMNGAS